MAVDITPEAVKEVIAETASVSEHDLADATTMRDLGMASLDVADLVFSLEDEFNIDLNEELFDGDTTVAGIVALCVNQRKAAE